MRRTRPLTRERLTKSTGREPDAGELPTCIGGKEIAVGAANVVARGGDTAASQHVLIAHEFAVVLAHRAGGWSIAGIARVTAARPLPRGAHQSGGGSRWMNALVLLHQYIRERFSFERHVR